MHAEKIRSVDLLSFNLSTRDALALTCLVGLAAYIIGLVVGLAY